MTALKRTQTPSVDLTPEIERQGELLVAHMKLAVHHRELAQQAQARMYALIRRRAQDVEGQGA